MPLALIGASLLGLVLLLALVSEEPSSSNGPAPLPAAEEEGPPPEQRCIDKWNSDTSESEGPGSTAVTVLAGTTGGASDLYVSVGYAEDFPDKCLVTVADSRSNMASQFTETSGEGPEVGDWSSPTRVSVSALDDTTKEFNASIDVQGELSLK